MLQSSGDKLDCFVQGFWSSFLHQMQFLSYVSPLCRFLIKLVKKLKEYSQAL